LHQVLIFAKQIMKKLRDLRPEFLKSWRNRAIQWREVPHRPSAFLGCPLDRAVRLELSGQSHDDVNRWPDVLLSAWQPDFTSIWSQARTV